MGGGGSTRRITLEKDEATGMVKVSEDVLRRMLGQEELGSKEEQRVTPDIQKLEREWQSRYQAQEQRWQERLKHAEKNNKVYEVTADEFQKAAEEVENKFRKQSHVPICQDLQGVVLKCFQENPKETLKCSQQVRDFTKCVERARTSILTKKSLDDTS